MDNNWKKPKQQRDGVIQHHPRGDRLVSGKISQSNKSFLGEDNFQKDDVVITRTNTISDIETLTRTLPNDIRNYVYECLEEHSQAIGNILALGYIGEELFFRDFLSGPQNEITCSELDTLQEAFKDDRYELVPTIRFANKKLENSDDDIAETSSLVIEFHKRGMVF